MDDIEGGRKIFIMPIFIRISITIVCDFTDINLAAQLISIHKLPIEWQKKLNILENGHLGN